MDNNLSTVISLLALVVSIFVGITNAIREKNIKKRDLNDKIFLHVYLEYMTQKIGSVNILSQI